MRPKRLDQPPQKIAPICEVDPGGDRRTATAGPGQDSDAGKPGGELGAPGAEATLEVASR